MQVYLVKKNIVFIYSKCFLFFSCCKLRTSFVKKNLQYLFTLNSLFLMFGICEMVLWLIGLLLHRSDSQKTWRVKIMGRSNKFLSLKVNLLSIESVLSSRHAILLFSWTFFMKYTIKVVRKVNNTDQAI